MILSAEQTLQAIRRILEDKMLPKMETASWAASNIRARLALLTYAEDCLQLERPLLLDTNEARRTLFMTFASPPCPSWLSASTFDALRIIVGTAPTPSTAKATELITENERYKSRLTQLVQCAAVARKVSPGAAAVFRAELSRRSRAMLPL